MFIQPYNCIFQIYKIDNLKIVEISSTLPESAIVSLMAFIHAARPKNLSLSAQSFHITSTQAY